MAEKLWYLKGCDLFEKLAPEELARVESRCRARKFPRNSPIYLPVDQADAVLLLASGRAKICSFTVEGKQGILAFIEPGELFGELAIFESGERDEYAEAVEPSTVVLIPADEMRRLVEDRPEISLGVTKLIGLRRKRIERRLKYLLFHSNRERLIHLLLELADRYGIQAKDGVDMGIRLSHQELANVIGCTRETVTVTLGELQAEGYLKMGRRKILLTKIEQLAASVQLGPPRLPNSSGKSSTPAANSSRIAPARNASG